MLIYDYESFKYDWLVVILDMINKREHVIVNDPKQLEEVFEENMKNIWAGYNVIHYDQWIKKGILCGFDPKKISDFIIEKGKAGWMFSSLLNKVNMINYDIMLNNDKGLKTLEGFMGDDIRESSVPFDIQRKLTQKEIEEIIKYCRHDVYESAKVMMGRMDEFNTKMFFIKHFNLPLQDLEKTKAQLAAKILGGNYKGKTFDDEFQFPILDCIELKKYKFVADWYRNPKNHNYELKQENVMIAGVSHTFAWGGAHGARERYRKKGDFLLIDVTAYYPSLQKKYKFGYRVMNHPENFEFIHDSNIEFKRKGDKKKRQPFKIMDNAVGGQLKQKSSSLYDPMSNNSICINGQLLLLDLIEHLEPYCELVQNNTDGIIVRLYDYERDFDVIDSIVADWEKRTGMTMEFETFFGEIFQKDVNNYLIIDREIGTVKAKGEYLKQLSDLDYDLPIVNKAMKEYMVHGIPVERTIRECDDFKEFQMIRKISKKYSKILHGGHWSSYRDINPSSGRMKTFDRFIGERKELKERCIRVYASLDSRDGGLWKVKTTTNKIEKLEGTPIHSFIHNESVNGVKVPSKLDKQWYIDLAKKRLNDFGVI